MFLSPLTPVTPIAPIAAVTPTPIAPIAPRGYGPPGNALFCPPGTGRARPAAPRSRKGLGGLSAVDPSQRDSNLRERHMKDAGLESGLDEARRMVELAARYRDYETLAPVVGWPCEPASSSTAAYLPADARADDANAKPVAGESLRLSARTLAHGAVIKGLRGRRGDAPIEYQLELPAHTGFLSATLSGGTGAAQIGLQTVAGDPVPGCERVGLDTGTYKACVVDLRAPALSGVDRMIARIEVAPHVRGFRNVVMAVKVADFDTPPTTAPAA